MKLSTQEARQLAIDVFTKAGMQAAHSEAIADHIIYAEAGGDQAGGMARVLALVEEFRDRPSAGEITITEKGRSSAFVDGGGHTGYITSVIAIDKAIELATATGFGAVGLGNSWFSGQLAYYVERAATKGFVALHCTNGKARVAPTGGLEAVLGTNPLTFGFPADPRPVVIDIGTSSITVAELMLQQKLGNPLGEGIAVDRDGNPTTEPSAAWTGAILPWGGHRGYGIALAVQLLGILGGGATVVRDVSDSGFFFLVFDPAVLLPADEFREKVSELVRHIESSRPAAGVEKVRVHGMKSARRRESWLQQGVAEIDDLVYAALLEMKSGVFKQPVLSNRKGAGE